MHWHADEPFITSYADYGRKELTLELEGGTKNRNSCGEIRGGGGEEEKNQDGVNSSNGTFFSSQFKMDTQNMIMWMTFAFVSAAASLTLMIYSRITRQPLHLIFYLSLCDFFLSLNNGLGYALRLNRGGGTLDGFWCSFTFFVEHTSVISQIAWYSMISLNILLILFNWREAQLRSIQIYQHILIWGYAFGATLPHFFEISMDHYPQLRIVIFLLPRTGVAYYFMFQLV